MEMKKAVGGYFNRKLFENYLALENSPIFQKMIGPTIKRHLPDLAGKDVYDVGFGTGFCLKILLKEGVTSYTGLDLNTDMVSYLQKIAHEIDSRIKVNFVQGDNSKPIEHNYGPFDFVISSFAVYANSYNTLLGFTNHLYSAVKQHGLVFLLTYHADFIHDDEHIDIIEDQYNHYFLPKLSSGQKYDEFAKVELIATPPYLKNEVRFNEEYVLNKQTVKKALQEAGFKYLMRRDMLAESGYEELNKYGNAFGINMYVCKKS
jgi:SAM-dependent methyltransferase